MKTVVWIIIFAIAFGFVEAAVVVYLRHLLGTGFTPPQVSKDQVLVLTPGIAFLDPKTALLIIEDSGILRIEQFREAATLIMLATVALLAGRRLKDRIAYFLLAFGIWDIFYYLFLKLAIDWPKSFTDPDIFFLLPVPWVGPVITPILISSILVFAAVIFILREARGYEEK